MPSKASTLTDVELALLRSSLHASVGDDGRVVGSGGVGLIVTRAELRLVAGDGVPDALHAHLSDAVGAAVPGDLSDETLACRLRAIVADHVGAARLSGGPAYVFDTVPAVALREGYRIVLWTEPGAAQNARSCPPNWSEGDWSQLLGGGFGPWAIVVDEHGAVASYCHTPGTVTAAGAEAGVWTHPAHRGKGLVGAATAAWAQAMQAPGRVLFYSTDRDNAASQRVASRLWLREFAWEWAISPGEWPEGDAWGRALADHHSGRYVPRVELQTGDGSVGKAMRPEWFFRSYDEWDWWERELLQQVKTGPVLDLGAGAGRAGLWLQERGFEVTSVEASPLAARVCRSRGLSDVRLGDLNDPPDDRHWSAVLLLCGNLGLGGSHTGVRQLLARLASICAPEAVLVGDTVEPPHPGAFQLRIRYKDAATPWWDQYNIPIAEIPAVVEGTGWVLDRHLIDGSDHAVLLRRSLTS